MALKNNTTRVVVKHRVGGGLPDLTVREDRLTRSITVELKHMKPVVAVCVMIETETTTNWISACHTTTHAHAVLEVVLAAENLLDNLRKEKRFLSTSSECMKRNDR